MGWGAATIRISLVVDEHGGDKEARHSALAKELTAEIRAVVGTERYQEIVIDVDTSGIEEDE